MTLRIVSNNSLTASANESEAVKEGFIDVYLRMRKPIPELVVRLDIPYPIFQQLDNRNEFEPFVVG